MAPRGYFSVAARKREKQKARERDENLMASGQVSPQQIKQRNSFFAALDRSKVRIAQRRAAIRVA